MPNDLDSVFTRVGALRLHAVHAAPPRPSLALPVVMVHGAIISGRYMRPTVRLLAAHVDCWAPDLPGHGKSDTPPRQLDMPGYADALAGWMDAVGIPRALLVGNSFGCQVLAHFAVRHPGRAAGLVLTGPTVDARARSAVAQAWRIFRDAFHERFSLWLIELAEMARVGPFRMVAMLRATLDDRIEAVLPRVRVPVRVVRGEKDTLSPREWAAHLATIAGAPPLIEVPGAAHGLNYDAPAALAAIVLEFARELAPAPIPATRA